MRKERVLLVDGNQPTLQAVRSLLAPDFEIVGAVNDGQAALGAFAQLRPDVVVLDISMPVLNGVGAARFLRETDPTAKIVFLTVNHAADLREAALETGALGYVTKVRMGIDLVQAIRLALDGRQFVSPGSG